MNKVTKLSLAMLVSLLTACLSDSPNANPKTPTPKNAQAEKAAQADKNAQTDKNASKDKDTSSATKDFSEITETEIISKSNANNHSETPNTSSSRDNSSSPSNTTDVSTNTENFNNTYSDIAPTVPVPVTPDFPVYGYAYTLGGEVLMMKDDVKDIESDDLNILNVEGKSLTLIGKDENPYNRNYFITDDNKKYLAGLKSEHLRYGIVSNELGEATVFVHGKPTTEMPHSGITHYMGPAILLKQINDVDMNGYAEFKVDFTKKELAGFIRPTNFDKLYELEAKIKDNTFEGTKDSVMTKGRFYGPKAAALGGVFHDKETGVGGAYGASQYNPDELGDARPE